MAIKIQMILLAMLVTGCIYVADANDPNGYGSFHRPITNVDRCVSNGGEPLARRNECNGITKNTCQRIGGKHIPCASSCPDAVGMTMCIMSCRVTCKIEMK